MDFYITPCNYGKKTVNSEEMRQIKHKELQSSISKQRKDKEGGSSSESRTMREEEGWSANPEGEMRLREKNVKTDRLVLTW